MVENDIISRLRSFEKQEEEKLNKLIEHSSGITGAAKKNIDNNLKEEKKKLQDKMQEELQKAKANAKEDSKEIAKEYKKKIEQLESKSSKNFEKAVDRIFSIILDKNG